MIELERRIHEDYALPYRALLQSMRAQLERTKNPEKREQLERQIIYLMLAMDILAGLERLVEEMAKERDH